MSFLNYNYTSNQKSVIDTEEHSMVEDKNNIEVEEQSEKQTKEEIKEQIKEQDEQSKEQDEQSKEQLDSELESFYHIIPLNVRYYSHMAYVQFRELIENGAIVTDDIINYAHEQLKDHNNLVIKNQKS